jgi:ribose transport system substrate-binding protein
MKRFVIPAAILVAAVAFSGCGKKQTASTGTTGAAKAKWVIGMSQCNLAEPYRVQQNKDIAEEAAKHPEIRVVFKDAQNNSETQQNQVKEFAQLGVNLLIVSPKEGRPLTKPVADAYKAGIPVVVLERQLVGDQFTCLISPDNVQIGREAGKFLVRTLGGKGSIVELKGLMTSSPAQDRHSGFMEGIKGSKLTIVFDADCAWLEDHARREMNSALARFPQIDAVYGHNDPSAHGAYMAAQQEGRGREKTIKFIGIDALPTEGVRYVRGGILSATFQYQTCGKEAVQAALKILGGERVPKLIRLGTRIYTKENVAKGGEKL